MKKTLYVLLFVPIILILLSSTVLADDITSAMTGVGQSTGNAKILTIGGQILSVVLAIAQVAAIISLLVMAIKYMISAPADKAEYKAKLVPYIIGAVLIFASATFLSIAQGLGQAITNVGIGAGGITI